MPVKNYSPDLLRVFKAGAKLPDGFTFDCGSEKAAIKLRWRLHALRREMRKEKHWLVPVAESVVVTVKGNSVIVRTPDADIEDDLKKALAEQAPQLLEPPLKLSVLSSPAKGIEDYLKGGKK